MKFFKSFSGNISQTNCFLHVILQIKNFIHKVKNIIIIQIIYFISLVSISKREFLFHDE